MAEYLKIKDTALSAFFSKLKAFFWHKADVVNVPLADVATSGDYNDLINKPSGGGGVPAVKMVYGDLEYYNVAMIGFPARMATSKQIYFSVAGKQIADLYAQNVEIVGDMIQGESDGQGGVYIDFTPGTETYYINLADEHGALVGTAIVFCLQEDM